MVDGDGDGRWCGGRLRSSPHRFVAHRGGGGAAALRRATEIIMTMMIIMIMITIMMIIIPYHDHDDRYPLS